MMVDEKLKIAPKEPIVASADLDQDISYSLWRRGSVAHLTGETLRRPGAMLRS